MINWEWLVYNQTEMFYDSGTRMCSSCINSDTREGWGGTKKEREKEYVCETASVREGGREIQIILINLQFIKDSFFIF